MSDLIITYKNEGEVVEIPCDADFESFSGDHIPFQTRYSPQREAKIVKAQNKTLQIMVKFEDKCYLTIKGRLVVIGPDNDVLNFGIVAEKPPIFHPPRYAGNNKYIRE
jgi:hypothetical protein